MTGIEKISFGLEIVTPMFLSGAKQTDVEIRPQSVKGILRYWYRALLGGIGVTEIDELKKYESFLWGREEQGSTVAIRIKSSNMIKKDNMTLDLGYDWTKRQTRNPGRTYLFFSTFMGGNNRPYYDAGSKFTVELISNREDARKRLSLASCALWTWVNLGAIGTRSRRGGGNLKIINASQNKDITLPEINEDSSSKQYSKHLSNGLTFCLKKVAELNDLKRKDIKDISDKICFPIINSNYLSIWIAEKTWNNWQSAMEEIGSAFLKFRSRRDPSLSHPQFFRRWFKIPSCCFRTLSGLSS